MKPYWMKYINGIQIQPVYNNTPIYYFQKCSVTWDTNETELFHTHQRPG